VGILCGSVQPHPNGRALQNSLEVAEIQEDKGANDKAVQGEMPMIDVLVIFDSFKMRKANHARCPTILSRKEA